MIGDLIQDLTAEGDSLDGGQSFWQGRDVAVAWLS